MYKLKGKELEERKRKRRIKRKKQNYKDPEMFGYAPMSSNF